MYGTNKAHWDTRTQLLLNNLGSLFMMSCRVMYLVGDDALM